MLALVVAFAAFASRASVRCDLAVPSNAGACIDPRTLKGQTLQVPANVTRIGEDGLALCTPTYVQTMSSDIVYIIDNSASMSVTSFWVDTTTNDTSWFIRDCRNSNPTADGLMTYLRLRHYGGTTGWDSLGYDSLFRFTERPGRCTESNDPYNMRAQAVRVALDYQAAFDSASMAGVVYFNKQLRQTFPMRSLGQYNRKTLVDSVGMYEPSSGTSWATPFDTAQRWLSKMTSGRNKAIILVSDGEPDDQSAYTKIVNKMTSIPIYGIYLGQSSDVTTQLDNVTSKTNGRKFVVPPDRPDSLEGVIKSIVASVTRKDAPSASSITNVTNGQVSRTVAVKGDSLDAWKLALDSAVALAPGVNYIQSITNWKTSGGPKVDTSVFILDVSGPTAPLGETPLFGAPLSARCHEGSVLQFVNSAWVPIALAVEGEKSIGIRLTPSGEATLPLRLSVTSGANDLESITLGGKDSVGVGSWGRQLPLDVARISAADVNNAAIEARSGYDTLRSNWCHPRDARDCAEASLPVNSFRSALVRWIPAVQPGSTGSFVLEALLPGQPGNTVSAVIVRRGQMLGSTTLVRVQDSLFRDTVHFAQGNRRPGIDTLWLASPYGSVPDSLIAAVVWGLDSSVLADTAIVTRPPLVLSLERVGMGDVVSVALSGGQKNASGTWPVRLSAGNRSQVLDLDAMLLDTADVTALAATGKGQTWIKGVFVDPVYGDTAVDSVLVPAPSSYLQFTPEIQDGPVGTFRLTADVPGATGATINVVLWRRGVGVGNVILFRQPDSNFVGAVSFRQGPVRPGGDTLWMHSPQSEVPDTLAATLVDATTGDTLRDTALVRRPSMRLTARSSGGSTVSLNLVGGFSDTRGARNVDVVSTSIQRVSLDSTGNGTVDVLSQLSKTSGTQAIVRAVFVDPVYGDTARDSVAVAVPVRTLRFVDNSLDGPRGSFSIELSDPWAAGDTRDVVISHGRDSALVRLKRAASGLFVGDRAFTQATTASGDTLTLGRPLAGLDSVMVILPRFDSLPRLIDRATIVRPPLSLVLVAAVDKPQLVQMALVGGNANAKGEANVLLSGPVSIPVTQLAANGVLTWKGERNLDSILPESPDPVVIVGLFVDPIYGDSARDTLSVKSPWFPARISVNPAEANPREDDTIEIRVHDKDAYPAEVDTIVVKIGSRSLKLVETGANTGDYVLRTIPGKVDPDWKNHPPRAKWRVELVYTDPDHPLDVARTLLALEYDVPPPEVDPYGPLQKAQTNTAAGKPVLQVVAPNSDGHYAKGAQGVEVKVWERTRLMAYVYDKIGTAVGSWEGHVDAKDPEKATRYLVKWDGYDSKGQPTSPGIYLIRVVLVADDGKMLGNSVYSVGRR